MKWLRRNVWRILIALGAAALALGYVPESRPELGSLLPRLSPILSLFGALAARAWLGWLMLLGIPLLVLAFFKGRFFCWHLCPMGFVSETAGKLNPWGKGLLRRVPAGSTRSASSTASSPSGASRSRGPPPPRASGSSRSSC